jgi:hypothetical protein
MDHRTAVGSAVGVAKEIPTSRGVPIVISLM